MYYKVLTSNNYIFTTAQSVERETLVLKICRSNPIRGKTFLKPLVIHMNKEAGDRLSKLFQLLMSGSGRESYFVTLGTESYFLTLGTESNFLTGSQSGRKENK